MFTTHVDILHTFLLDAVTSSDDRVGTNYFKIVNKVFYVYRFYKCCTFHFKNSLFLISSISTNNAIQFHKKKNDFYLRDFLVVSI